MKKNLGIIRAEDDVVGMMTVKQALKNINVAGHSIAASEQDLLEGFDLGVARYMIKLVGYVRFVEVIKTINLYSIRVTRG